MKYIIFSMILFSTILSCNIVTGEYSFTITGPETCTVWHRYNSHIVNHGPVETPYSYSYPIINNSIYYFKITASDNALITVYIDGVYHGEAVGSFEY